MSVRKLAWLLGLLLLVGCGPQPGNEPNLPTETLAEQPPADAGTGVVPETGTSLPDCQAGTNACRCQAGGICDAGLRCVNNTCQVCPPGTSGCACQGGTTCQAGLQCQQGICQGCQGKSHCACYSNNNCDAGNRCEQGKNGAAVCVPCEKANAQGCNCSSDADCGSLLCINKRCADPSVLKDIPKQPKCYTPCEGDIEQNGQTLSCHPVYRLREGCLAGQTCQEGSCIPTGNVNKLSSDTYPYCQSDVDCPSWQTCLQGRCYSNCTDDSHCPSGFQCHSYVCRRKCNVNVRDIVCAKVQTCQSQSPNGDGLCMPKITRQLTPGKRTQTTQAFVLTPTALLLNNQRTTGQIMVENKNAFKTTFSIKRLSDNIGSTKPLQWLRIDRCKTYNADRTQCTAFEGNPGAQEPFIQEVEGQSRVILRILEANRQPASHTSYVGLLEIYNDEIRQQIQLQYHQGANGRWRGTLYSFGNFNDEQIAQFPADPNLDLKRVSNALLQQWILFKRNQLSYDKFQAVLRSIQDGTWSLKRTQQECQTLFSQTGSEDVACYPFASSKGYEILSQSQRQAPVPSGVSSLDFAMDVEEKPGNQLQGRILSSEALQYPGDPAIQLSFASQPGKDAISFVTGLSATIDIGSRYHIGQSDNCTAQDAKVSLPWMLLDFTANSYPASALLRTRYECRTKTAPRSPKAGATAAEKATVEAYNLSLSGANPIPNGRVLRRQLELVDGVLYQNRVLFVLVKERFVSIFPSSPTKQPLSQDLVRYGYLFLERADRVQDDFNPKGNPPAPVTSCTNTSSCASGQVCQSGTCVSIDRLQQVTCTPDVIQKAMNITTTNASNLLGWSQAQLDDLVSVLITGQTVKSNANTSLQVEGKQVSGQWEFSFQDNNTTHYIHYLCEDTGQFDGGPVNSPQACPAGSRVLFFSLPSINTASLRGDSCQVKDSQGKASCQQKLDRLRSSTVGFREKIPYRCKGKKQVFCDDVTDLRKGKIFFKPAQPGQYISPYAAIENAMQQAFRYRLKFINRSGQNIGFTPTVCQGNASNTPYCYDPKAIEELEARVNCLEHIIATPALSQRLSTQALAELASFLKKTFSFSNRNVNGTIVTDFGLETLNAELKIMLGDEAYAKALSSRYDQAATGQQSFPGDTLEPNGIALSGTLGFEMYQLYLSTQYYQTVLDRFYAQTAVFSASFRSSATAFLTVDTVTSLLQKVNIAASRKTRSWGTIAKKYHAMNRSDLARHVLERSYISTYVEMMVLTRLLRQLMLELNKSQTDQLRQSIRDVARVYSAALLGMKSTYKQVSQQLDAFGFPPGYIPIPAMDRYSSSSLQSNIFAVSLNYLKAAVFSAQEKEQFALQFNRSYETQAALFQSELANIETSYNNQLREICGSITVGGELKVAIPENMDPKATSTYSDNPCGRVPGSRLYEAYLALERLGIYASQMQSSKDALDTKIKDEEKRIQSYCRETFSLADVTWTYQGKNNNLSGALSKSQFLINQAVQAGMGAIQAAQSWKCVVVLGDAFGGSCQFAGISNALTVGVNLGQAAITTLLGLRKIDLEKESIALNQQLTKSNLRTACEVCPPKQPNCGKQGVARIASQNYLAQLALKLKAFEIEAVSAQISLHRAMSTIRQLKEQVEQILREREEAINLLTRVQAVHNDPNTRIYKNDAVIAAERTFVHAIREAYRTTLVYEYYTATSYARKGDLFLIRMISVGDKNLETYTSQLEQAFRDFEERNSKPDLRVAVLSLRDDILKIPRAHPDNTPRTLSERIADLQQRLITRDNMTSEGYVSFPFNLSVYGKSAEVSPITYNHKVLYVEAEIVGGELGDGVGRLYLLQQGTSVIRQTDDTLKYYNLPIRTAVLNPFFNGSKVFDPNVYQNFRLQDRPLGNTRWVLQFNQASEKSNQDINTHTIDDIRLYIYYTDFTKP